ncbi:hypothetical protein [Ruminococcus sp.]|uniref:hypothetical protein n=1 Tax=Ruminococcus sp. TaxID=41978 RepID=UPI002E7FF20B|nr:hypothetical protein [Ruminococcus sp.]MEE3492644.1 hypothetical protein [Ruminococcus sp.]
MKDDQYDKYTANGFVSEDVIELGCREKYLNGVVYHGDMEELKLIYRDSFWFLKNIAVWSHSAGSSNSGEIITKIDREYLISNNIRNRTDFLDVVFRCSPLKPCREMIEQHADVIKFLDSLISSLIS